MGAGAGGGARRAEGECWREALTRAVVVMMAKAWEAPAEVMLVAAVLVARMVVLVGSRGEGCLAAAAAAATVQVGAAAATAALVVKAVAARCGSIRHTRSAPRGSPHR